MKKKLGKKRQTALATIEAYSNCYCTQSCINKAQCAEAYMTSVTINAAHASMVGNPFTA